MQDRVLTTPALQPAHNSLIEFVRSVADPLVSMVCLLASSLFWLGAVGPGELVLGVMAFLMLYPSNVAFRHRQRNLVGAVFGIWMVTVGLLWTLGMVSGLVRYFDEEVLITWIVATPLIQVAVHWFAPIGLKRLVSIRHMQRVVVVGANELGLAFARSISGDKLAHSKIVGFFDDRSIERLGETDDWKMCGRISAVGRFVRDNRIDQIFIALPMASQRRILDLLNDLRDTTASIYFLPDIFMFDLIQGRVDTLSDFPVVAVCESPFQGTRGAIKRTFDVLVALCATAICLPLMLLIAIGIKAGSPGPVIFRQRRFGLDGEEIMVYKFRSMTVTEDGRDTYKQVQRGDARVTPFGAFLRKTSLDELPQFINVLQGRMSVVGPRPHAIAVNDTYRKLIPGYMVRHKVRPGITGWAQVNGYRGGDDLPAMRKRIEYDLQYLRNWSLWMDLRIIGRTVGVLFGDARAF